MPLKLGTNEQLWGLVDHLKKPFAARDEKWANRRKIRYRQMEDDLAALPLNPTIQDKALMVHQTEMPNQEVHQRVKRLVANLPRFEVIVYDDDPDTQRLGQSLEDGLKALYKWMNRGKVSFDWRVTQYQVGDGLGIGKAEFVPGHGDVLAYYDNEKIGDNDEDEESEDADEEKMTRGRNEARGEYRKALGKYKDDDTGREAKAYNDVTEDALKKELPPFRLIAVDPLTCYWWEDDDGIEVIAEVGKKSLNPLLEVFGSYGLGMSEDGGRLFVTPGDMSAVGGQTAPASRMHKDISTQVDYIEIRTRQEIAILIEHPKIKEKSREKSRKQTSDRGVILRFDNPFGPYTTGYTLLPGDITTEVDPADAYQPPVLSSLNIAQAQNVLMTARLSAALEAALAPAYIKVEPEQQVPPADEDKTPEVKEGREVPQIAGEIKRIESPLADLDKTDMRLTAEYAPFAFKDVLQGESQSEATGHRLAIQVAQADLQMVPYQNARSKALEELLKGIVYAVRRHGLTIYIPTIPGGPRSGTQLRVAEYAKLAPDMADLNFELIITLGAETPTTKYAKWQALRDREEAGTVGYQTVMEQSDVENPEDEIVRVFEGKMLKAVMEQAVPLTVQLLMQRIQEKLAPPPPPQPEVPPGMEMGIPPETGLAGGGGPIGPVAGEDFTRLPGVNMPVVQSPGGIPEPTELGGVPLG